MGSSPDSSPEKKKKKKNPNKNDVVVGYPPSQDQTQQAYPPPAPPYNPKNSDTPQATTSTAAYQQYPTAYAAAPSPYQPYAAAPSPYQPYPPPPPNYPYPPAPGPTPPYVNDYYYQQHIRQESNMSGAFGRVLLMLMLMLVASILMMSLVMWFLFGASVPEFEVGSIKVSNLTATNASLVGAWSVQMWVSNVNMELDVRFDHGMSYIFYKDSMVAVSPLETFDVRKTQRYGLNFSVAALQDQRWAPPSLAEDRSDGVVVVSLRLAVDANFTGPNVVYRKERLKVLCEDFPIGFALANSAEGALLPSLGNNCFIRLHEGHD